MHPKIKPSDIDSSQFPGSFLGKAEAESIAFAMLVYCQQNGNIWQPVPWNYLTQKVSFLIDAVDSYADLFTREVYELDPKSESFYEDDLGYAAWVLVISRELVIADEIGLTPTHTFVIDYAVHNQWHPHYSKITAEYRAAGIKITDEIYSSLEELRKDIEATLTAD